MSWTARICAPRFELSLHFLSQCGQEYGLAFTCTQAFFLCIWTKTQVGSKLRFSPKLRYFSRNSGSKIGKLRYSETNHLKFSVFKRKNASTERFYVLTAGKNCRCLYKKKLSKIFQNSGPFLLKTQVSGLQNSGPMNKKLRSELQKLR